LFKEYGWWFPEGEIHLPKMCMEHMNPGERGNYQRKKYERAMKWVHNHRRALDIGGHIGLWSLDMVRDFDVVETFEPVDIYRECFKKNVTGANLYPFACGDEIDRVSFGVPTEGHTGHTVVVPGDDVEVVILDDFHFTDVDFMKVDCEGYELKVLRGAEKTLLESRPVVIVEQKPGNATRYGFGETDAVSYLESLGMQRKAEMTGDYVMAWKAYQR
jgi:FkbM family methyltransferase